MALFSMTFKSIVLNRTACIKHFRSDPVISKSSRLFCIMYYVILEFYGLKLY